MNSPNLTRPRAVEPPDDHPEAGVPWHFGDPFAEQRAAARSAAVVDRSHRQVLAVRGDDRLSWLHLVISQHVSELPMGSGTEALVLDAHGRIEAHMTLAYPEPDGDEEPAVWLDADPGVQVTNALPKGGKQPLLEYLDAMRFWSKVTITDATAERAVLSVLGPDARDVLAKTGLPTGTADAQDYASAAARGVVVRRMPWPGRGSYDLLVPRDELVEWFDRLVEAGARPAGSWAFDALRVEALRPRLGVDTDERAIPHEVNWIGTAAHVAKGCYRGQETVAKVHNVGRPPRRMVLLHLDGSIDVLPETGDPVVLDGRTVGQVGTVIQHHELGPIALALVKRSVPTDAELLTGVDDRVVQAAIDPDSEPGEHVGPGRRTLERFKIR